MRTLVITPVDSPSPVAFENVYEEGDRWEKVVGCEGCPNIDKCCGNCPLLVPGKGCLLHLEAPRSSRKPFRCVAWPTPKDNLSWCQQEWRCVRGSHAGEARRVREPADVFYD